MGLPFLNSFADVVDFLFSYSLSIHNIKTVKVHNLFNVIVFINFIENLPGNVVINLLQHFLKLIITDSVLFIWTIFAIVVFAVGFLLKLGADFLILLHHVITFDFEIW